MNTIEMMVMVAAALNKRIWYEWDGPIPELNKLEVCVDVRTADGHTVVVEHARRVIAQFLVPWGQMNELQIGNLVDQHCDLAAVRAHHRLETHFPGRISRVTGRRDVEKRCTYFTIHFKNGHQFEVLDSELESEFNIAKGIMVYDLPPL